MLAEIALTPSLFSDTEQPAEWRSCLEELARVLLPRRHEPAPALVADLQDGQWTRIAARTIASIRDQNTRFRCQAMVTALASRRLLAQRPACGILPSDEAGWSREAIQSGSQSPLDRILVCDQTFTSIQAESQSLRPLSKVTSDDFWDGIPHDGHVARDIGIQVKTLRALTLHSDFLWFVSPYVHGTTLDDTEFVVALFKAAFDRPPGFSRVQVEIHTDELEKPWSASGKLRKSQSKLEEIVRKRLSKGLTIPVFYWPDMLERVLVGGTLAQRTNAPPELSVRWGISMTHVARRNDDANQFSEWKLLSPAAAQSWFEAFSLAKRSSTQPQLVINT